MKGNVQVSPSTVTHDFFSFEQMETSPSSLILMIFDTSVIIYLVERAMYKLFEWIEELISGRRTRIYSISVQLFDKPCWQSWWLGEQKLWRRRGWQAQALWLVTSLQSFTHSIDTVFGFGFSTGNKTKAQKSVTVHLIKFDVSETNCKTCKKFWRITLVWTGEAANKPCKELMAALPLPPSGSQGSRVSPGEAPSWLYATNEPPFPAS